MAGFVVQVFKLLTGDPREWTNRYILNAPSLADAVIAADEIVGQEVHLHPSVVTITRARISDLDPDTDVFQIVSYGTVCDWYSNASEQYIPLFNTVRVDIDVSGGGRPSRKYYRGPIGEGHVVNGFLDATTGVAHFDSKLAAMITAVSAAGCTLVDPDGQAWLSPHTQAPVQMRQRHRRRRKAGTPA